MKFHQQTDAPHQSVEESTRFYFVNPEISSVVLQAKGCGKAKRHVLRLGKVGERDGLRMLDDGALRRAAQADLPPRIERLARQTGLRYAGLTIRAARTKWGSCSGRNTISLNLYLMTLPEHLRDFVILHELCHTVHHDHSPRFHALLDRLTGGREKELARELKRFAIRG